MLSDEKKFYDENKEYVNDLRKELPLCSKCTRRLDLHETDSSICESPWYVISMYVVAFTDNISIV